MKKLKTCCKFIETNHTEFNLQVAMSKLYTSILYTDKLITVSLIMFLYIYSIAINYCKIKKLFSVLGN